MNSKIFSATLLGTDAHLVEVEIDIEIGASQFYFVGLADRTITESKRRIVSALKNSGMKVPDRKITVNLAPADLKKEGTSFDLPIAVALMLATEIVKMSPQFIQETLFVGELSLHGNVRGIRGVLAMAFDAKKLNKKRLIVSHENVQEASLIEGIEIIGISSLSDLFDYISTKKLSYAPKDLASDSPSEKSTLDFGDVKGQYQAKRMMQIAAAGQHNVIFVGPPGSGKTMLAQRLPSIMPDMTYQEIVDTSRIYSLSSKEKRIKLITKRPFRNPHHSTSQAGLIGGGSPISPGEISLAQNGVLFLDELTEFRRPTLEGLRQPLEDQRVNVVRAQGSVTFPANFLLIAALNPCPCGFLGDSKKTCTCTKQQIDLYLKKLSGPLLDRIDLQAMLQSLDYNDIKESPTANTTSDELRKKIDIAVIRQRERCNEWNGKLSLNKIDKYCLLSPEAEETLKLAFDRLKLSMRGYHKILRVAKTIADLESNDIIGIAHIKEALMYRTLDQTLEKMKS